MKNRALIASAILIAVAGLFWMLYPTSFKSELKTFLPIPQESYEEVRRSAIDFSKEVDAKGVRLSVGSDPDAPFQFFCGDVPLLLVNNGSIALTVNIMANSDERAPELRRFREEMLRKFTPAGGPLETARKIEQPRGLEAFMLKYRDGIDVSKHCR
ncbi:hypothetical protein EGJ34_00640 [Stenotrophomonas sp. 278]|nr:hypothetical protein EGJ34_00640 [Stenotrophomonas sp. 278]